MKCTVCRDVYMTMYYQLNITRHPTYIYVYKTVANNTLWKITSKQQQYQEMFEIKLSHNLVATLVTGSISGYF